MSSAREDVCTFNEIATVVPFYYEFGDTRRKVVTTSIFLLDSRGVSIKVSMLLLFKNYQNLKNCERVTRRSNPT